MYAFVVVCCCFCFNSIIAYRFSLHNLSIWTQAFSLSSNLHIIQACSLLWSSLFQNVTYNITVHFKIVQPFNYYWKVRTVSFSHNLLMSWNLCDWLQLTANTKFYLMIDVFSYSTLGYATFMCMCLSVFFFGDVFTWVSSEWSSSDSCFRSNYTSTNTLCCTGGIYSISLF